MFEDMTTHTHDSAGDRHPCSTKTCNRSALVCDECVRALAFEWWGAIARHGEDVNEDKQCFLREIGYAMWCPECALLGEHSVVNRRDQLRKDGHTIGEPAWAIE